MPTTKSAALSIVGFKKQLAADYQNQIINYFSGDKEKAMRFMTALSVHVQKTPKLLETDRATLMTAAMTCAELQLYPSNVTGEAFIIPYGGKAQFQLGYQGVLTLLYRAGVENVSTEIVYNKDIFDYQMGLEPKLVHKVDLKLKDRGEAIGVYAIATLNGTKIYKFMTVGEVMKFKKLSQAAKSEFSPWNSDNDPEMWMFRKTAIKQLSKMLPKNESINAAFRKEVEKAEDETIQPASRALASDEAARIRSSKMATKPRRKEICLMKKRRR